MNGKTIDVTIVLIIYVLSSDVHLVLYYDTSSVLSAQTIVAASLVTHLRHPTQQTLSNSTSLSFKILPSPSSTRNTSHPH